MRTEESRYGDGDILSAPALRKDGTRIPVEFIIVPFANDDGRMRGIAAILRDARRGSKSCVALPKELAARRDFDVDQTKTP